MLGQTHLPFHVETGNPPLTALDLFSGIGGLSLGFRGAGFAVTGVDSEELAGLAFEGNRIGEFIHADLGRERVDTDVSVIIGGPPCRPWSAVNQQRRGKRHDDFMLLERFFAHLTASRPSAFLMENVPPLRGDPEYTRLCRELRWRGYSISAQVLRYSAFGAATARKRLFTVGFRDSLRWTGDEFFERLACKRAPARTVRGAIQWLENAPRGTLPDHEWSEYRTIHRYVEHYETGKYGWAKLAWDSPAPSFGSIGKTYILHPSSGTPGFAPRVLSVREALSIMGFEPDFAFPPNSGLQKRYRMVANAVSPIISRACATVLRDMFAGSSAVQRA